MVFPIAGVVSGGLGMTGDVRNDEKPQDIKLDFAVITAFYKNS